MAQKIPGYQVRHETAPAFRDTSDIISMFISNHRSTPRPNQAISEELIVPDPRRNITCLGDRSDYGYVQDYGNERSMQQLCADPLYGGGDTAPNFHGYCDEGDVFFSRYSGLNTLETQGDDAWKLLECRNRCFCNYDLPDPRQQPQIVAITRKTFNMGPLNPAAARVVNLDVRENERELSLRVLTRLYYCMTSSDQIGYVVS